MKRSLASVGIGDRFVLEPVARPDLVDADVEVGHRLRVRASLGTELGHDGATLDLVAFGHRHALDRRVGRRHDGVFHLHRLDDDDDRPGPDRFALGRPNRDHPPRHWSDQDRCALDAPRRHERPPTPRSAAVRR